MRRCVKLWLRTAKISGRLFACSVHASACALRQSPNANGRSDSLSDLIFLYSRQHHSQTLRVCSVMFSWTFGVAPLVAAPRLLKGRRRGRAHADFRSEPYVTLHPRRGFAYIRHILLRRQGADFFDTAALCYVARAQTFRPLLLPALSAAFHK